MEQKVFKLNGLDYYIVGAENIGMAVLICLINYIGVTEANIEEVTDKSTLPQKPDRIFSLPEINKNLLYEDIRKLHIK
jgi:hypothetical protein